MQKQITIQNQIISYTIRKNARAKRIKLTVYNNGTVTITIPRYTSKKVADCFVKEKGEWILSKITQYKKHNTEQIHCFDKNDYKINKEKARALIHERIKYFSTIYKLSYNKITIRDQKTRWGSCSSKGNLNFNYKIFFLDPNVRDYIIVHELCHLKELNHSKKFWRLVEKTFPNHKELRHKLKNTNISLR